MTEYIREPLELIATVISLVSVVILIWGVLICLINFFRQKFSTQDSPEGLIAIIRGKNALGVYLLLSLEILIAADIIESIANPDWQDILLLGAIVAIRTVISYFLNKEIKEGEEEIRERQAKLEAEKKRGR